MTMDIRIDKWLWAVRAFKTRSQAADACRIGRVTVNGHPAKPSREVRLGDLIVADHGHLRRTLRVTGLTDRRMAASLVKNFAEDLTPASEYARPREKTLAPAAFRPRGAGRPTKKDRRSLDRFFP
jgi:ribosome-associated heat shock protein Hsp15